MSKLAFYSNIHVVEKLYRKANKPKVVCVKVLCKGTETCLQN